MGGQVSVTSIEGNEFLKALQDAEKPNNAVQWDGISSIPLFYPAVLSDSTLDAELNGVVRRIVDHSDVTKRAGHLTQVLCNMISGWASNTPAQVPYGILCNYLKLLQCLCRALYEKSEGNQATLSLYGDLPKGGNVLQMVADTMLTFAEKHPLLNMEGMCLNAHVLVVSSLTVCVSSPLYTDIDNDVYEASPASPASAPATPLPTITEVIDHVCYDEANAARTVFKLLSFISKADYATPEQYSTPFGSLALLLDIAASYVLPSSLAKQISGASQRRMYTQQLSAHLGRRAALLMCVLLYRRKNDSKLHPTPLLQAFRAETDETEHTFPVAVLFDTFCRPGALEHPEMVLLLYTLLNENDLALEHILGHAEVSRLIYPITQLLHDVAAVWESPASLYVSMSVLLMCSQHRGFNSSIHTSNLPAVPWYTERTLRNISAGSLLILTLVRMVQYNVATGQDMYVTRQCLSILSNMSGVITNVHEYTAQRLVSLAAFLGKKLTKRRLAEEHDVLVEYLRHTVTCISLCLGGEVVGGTIKLVYELLHQRAGLEDLRQVENETLQAALVKVFEALDYFSSYLDDQNIGLATVENVTVALKAASPGWASGQQQATGDRFAFAEEASPEAFFVPYAWDMVLKYYSAPGGGIAWDPSTLPLFSSAKPLLDDDDQEGTQLEVHTHAV